MAAWSTEEVHTLVGVWVAADVQRQLDGVTRNKKSTRSLHPTMPIDMIEHGNSAK